MLNAAGAVSPHNTAWAASWFSAEPNTTPQSEAGSPAPGSEPEPAGRYIDAH